MIRSHSKQNFIGGAAVLTASVILVKLISACYKIPLGNILGDEGMGHFYAAYNIYNLLLMLSTAGLPLAVSKLVAEYRSRGLFGSAGRCFRVGLRLFLMLGTAGTAVMFFFAAPLSALLHDRAAETAIRVLSPAVLFVCLMSAVRGYTQGCGDMRPSAVSQVIEALLKLPVGLGAAWILLRRSGDVTLASAGAILGVSTGTAAGFLYLLGVLLFRRDQVPFSDRPDSDAHLLRRILAVGVPVTLGSAGMSLITLLDQAVILGRLQNALGLSEGMAASLYGQYTFGQNLFNLPASFIPPLTVSLIPAVSAALARQDHQEAERTVSFSLKLAVLFSLSAGAGLSVLAEPILLLLYPAQPEAAAAAAYHLQILGIASVFVSLMQLTNGILQACGRERVPICTMLAGGAVKLVINYIFVGNSAVGIRAAPVSTLICYALIAALNFSALSRTLKKPLRLFPLFAKPLLCTALMAAAAKLFYRILFPVFGNAPAVLISVAAAAILYAAAASAIGVFSRKELRFLPKGDKIADVLRIH